MLSTIIGVVGRISAKKQRREEGYGIKTGGDSRDF